MMETRLNTDSILPPFFVREKFSVWLPSVMRIGAVRGAKFGSRSPSVATTTPWGEQMDLDTFQKAALVTDNTDRNYEDQESRKDIVVALLGIAGELGTLSTAYKKFLRDGPSYGLYKDNVREELGDLLWYMAVLAHKFDLTLSEIAEHNLAKASSRWGTQHDAVQSLYDAHFPSHEQFPRMFTVRFSEQGTERKKVILELDGELLGDHLTDNSKDEDGYRYHDAFHLAFATILGWSPVLRKLMKKKRRSDPATDENDDGGRAIVIEEGITAFIFEYAEAHNRLAGVRAVDFDVLTTVKSMTRRLEVQSRSLNDWEVAIMRGFEIFRLLTENTGGFVTCDLDKGNISYAPEKVT